MMRVIVEFDILDREHEMNYRTVKLFNNNDTAVDYVHGYLKTREQLVWKYSEYEDLKESTPNAFVELHGYSPEDEDKCLDMITIYRVEAEDPDEDPIKRILRNLVEGYGKCVDGEDKDVDEEELSHMQYTMDILDYLLNKIDETEKVNQEEFLKENDNEQ